MKKEKFINPFNSRWLMVTFLALGFMCLSTFSVNAQMSTKLSDAVTSMTQLRDTFVPSSAKYDIVQEAIDYLDVLHQNVLANPNYLDQFLEDGPNPFAVDKMRRTHPSILATYTAAELAQFSVTATDGGTAPPIVQKLQWILDANAY